MTRLLTPAALAIALLSSLAGLAEAQYPWPTPDIIVQHRQARPRTPRPPMTLDDVPRHVISSGPSAWLFAVPNLEYEVRTLPFLAVGVSASRSHWTLGHSATNGEVFARVFPEGVAFDGFSVGVRSGVTRISDRGSFRNVAFEGAYTLTSKKRSYVSMGAGLRHVIGGPESVFGSNHPILRMNVGVGF